METTLDRQSDGDGAWGVIRVRDHGPGLPEEDLTHVFRPFYRVPEARERQIGGVGLGLAITQRAIRLHGGAVSAVNAPDGGLIARIRLPAVRTPSSNAATTPDGDPDQL